MTTLTKNVGGTVDVKRLEYARSTLPESMVFAGGSPEKTLPIIFAVYLLKTADRTILVDAGCVTMPGFTMVDFIGPIRALEREGLSPDAVTDVIITHAHHDHIECVKEFSNARIFIQKDEYEADNGKAYFAADQMPTLFDEQVEVAPSVIVRKIGGHSIGSCIVEISGGEKTLVIAGDECYARRCLAEKIPTGSSYNPEKSRAFVQTYGNEEKYDVLFCHDE